MLNLVPTGELTAHVTSTLGGSRGRGHGETVRPGAGLATRAGLSTAQRCGDPQLAHPTRGPKTKGGQRQNSLPSPLPQSRSRSLQVHLSLPLSSLFFFLQKEGRGGEKMLHCAARPVSERRGANQRSPFRKLPFMARAATALSYKTQRRDAHPLPRPRPAANTGLSPSLLRRQSTPSAGKAPGRPGTPIGARPLPSSGRRRLSLQPHGQRPEAGSGARALPARGRAALGARLHSGRSPRVAPSGLERPPVFVGAGS